MQRGRGFPVLVLLLGLVGSVLAALGLLGLFAPQAVSFAPILRESPVASALVASGTVFLVLELIVFLGWARRRRNGG